MSERLVGALHDDDLMPIGNHAGKRLGDVPDSYWRWFVDQPWSEEKYPALFDYGMVVVDD